MMGFAKIAGGAPSAVRAKANHLMNATSAPTSLVSPPTTAWEWFRPIKTHRC